MIDRLAPTCVTHALPPPALQSTAQQCVYVLVFVEGDRSVCGLRGARCTSATVFLVGGCAFCYFVCGIVACGTVCAPSPPPPAIISPAQQRIYLYVFVISFESYICGLFSKNLLESSFIVFAFTLKHNIFWA